MTHDSTRTTTLTTESLIAAAKVIPEGTPFFMLNLLRYKERADYGDRAGVAPCSGRDAYHQGYVAWFLEIAESEAVELAWFGGVLGGLVAPADERWDELAIVRYQEFASFRRIVESARYEIEAAPHRRAALEDWRLLATVKLG